MARVVVQVASRSHALEPRLRPPFGLETQAGYGWVGNFVCRRPLGVFWHSGKSTAQLSSEVRLIGGGRSIDGHPHRHGALDGGPNLGSLVLWQWI